MGYELIFLTVFGDNRDFPRDVVRNCPWYVIAAVVEGMDVRNYSRNVSRTDQGNYQVDICQHGGPYPHLWNPYLILTTYDTKTPSNPPSRRSQFKHEIDDPSRLPFLHRDLYSKSSLK